jgi:hypothetical protein
MFYQVRVLNGKKQLKKIFSTRELSRKHWADYEKKQETFASPRIRKK